MFERFLRDVSMRVTELTDDDRLWVQERTELLFGGDFVVSRTEVHDPHKLPGFIATEGRERVGLATYCIYGGECELVTIDRTDPAGPKDDALITFDTNATFTDDVFAFASPQGLEKIAFETVLGVK